MGHFWGWGLTTGLWSTHVVEKLSFSLFPSILTFDFDLILGSFLTFWGPNGLFSGLVWGSKLFWDPLMKINNFHFLLFPEV